MISCLAGLDGTIHRIQRATVAVPTVARNRKYPTVKAATSITTIGRTATRKMMNVSTPRGIGASTRKDKGLYLLSMEHFQDLQKLVEQIIWRARLRGPD